MGDDAKRNKPSSRVDDVTATLARGEEPELPLKDRIRNFRKNLKLSQNDLGERLGVSEATVNRWERGSRPQHDHFAEIIKLARKEGGLRQLVGANERELIGARFRNQFSPRRVAERTFRKGVALLIDFSVENESDFGEIVSGVCSTGGVPIKFVTLGEDRGSEKTEALFLVKAPTYKIAVDVRDFVIGCEMAHSPNIKAIINEELDLSPGRGSSL